MLKNRVKGTNKATAIIGYLGESRNQAVNLGDGGLCMISSSVIPCSTRLLNSSRTNTPKIPNSVLGIQFNELLKWSERVVGISAKLIPKTKKYP